MLTILRRKMHSARIRWHRAHMLGVHWSGGGYIELFERKHLLNALLRGAGVATVTDLALIERERLILFPDPASGVPVVSEVSSPRDYLASLSTGQYFLKPAVGIHGRNAGCLTRTETGFAFNGETVPIDDLLDRCRRARSGMLIQVWQPQHEGQERFCANTLNTLRILSLCRAGESPHAYHAVLRVGRRGAWLDNFHAGGIALRIDMQTGHTVGPGVRLDRTQTYERHPDTDMALDEQPVAEFQAACLLVQRAHGLFAEIPTIGWDVAISPDGPRIVEANLNWDAEIHAFTDPEFRRGLVRTLRDTR